LRHRADDPRRFLQSVNQLFFENSIDSVYATLFFADYDDQTRDLRYANYGHPAGFLLRSDGALERLDSTAPCSGCSNNGTAPLPNTISPHATRSFSIPTALLNRSTTR
jgi:phosphoserine phosphatase RsbU/P